MLKKHHFIFQLCLLISCFATPSASAQQSLQVRVNRWLRITEMTGDVIYQSRGTLAEANVGDRLQHVGDGLRTGVNSTAVLSIDTNIGNLTVASDSILRIQQLTTTADGARLTRIQVTEGHAHLQVRRFTNPNSSLEIETPAGAAAVRGTQFGFNVDQNGLMSLATLDGEVWVEAQGSGVSVHPGFQTIVVPGSPPQPPHPISTELYLRPRVITRAEHGNATVIAQIPPGTLMYVNGESYGVNLTGQINLNVPIPSNRTLDITLQAPAGRQQTYHVVIP